MVPRAGCGLVACVPVKLTFTGITACISLRYSVLSYSTKYHTEITLPYRTAGRTARRRDADFVPAVECAKDGFEERGRVQPQTSSEGKLLMACPKFS